MDAAYISGTIFVAAAALYALPGIVALARGRHNQWVILGLNLLLGWTVIGWLVGLWWACSLYAPRQKAKRSRDIFSNDNDVGVLVTSDADWDVTSADDYAEWLDHGDGITFVEPNRPARSHDTGSHARNQVPPRRAA